jgi:hypothetical protein
MLTFFSTLGAILIALLWYAFSVGANSHVRAKAQEFPESWIYFYITIFDQVLAATFFRPIRKTTTALSPASEPTNPTVADRERAAHAPEFMRANYAIRIFINPELQVPNHVWRLIRPGTLILICCGLAVTLCLLVGVVLHQFLEPPVAQLTVMFMIAACAVIMMVSMVMEWGPFHVSMKLHMNPFLVLFVTKQTTLLHSSWLPRTEMDTSALRFLRQMGNSCPLSYWHI